MRTEKRNVWAGVLHQKCPNCGKGEIFYKKKQLLELPHMRVACDRCRYRFYREPGYFLGAMYISYGLAVLEGILAFLFCYIFLPQLQTLYTVFCVISIITMLSMYNYKYARIIYMYIFPD